MIEFTLPGIFYWLAQRENLFYFYAILGLIFFVYHYKKLNSIPKTSLLTLSFLFFFMGLWELPLFLFGSYQGLIWILYLILYMIPFPVVCYVLKTKFNFTEKEFALSLFLVFFSIIFSDVFNYLYSFNPSLWNYGVSYLNRAVTFTFLFYIFKNISFPSIQSKTNLNYLKVLIVPLSILTTASIYKASQEIVYQNTFPGPLFEVLIGLLFLFWILFATLTFFYQFKPKSSWQNAQQHELNYYQTNKPSQWRIPHSFKYWTSFLQLQTLQGNGLEVGCGPTGLYHYTDNIIGIDAIKFKNKNFIHCTAEHLPFKPNSFSFIILCNSLDHCQSPSTVIQELKSLSKNFVVFSNIFPSPLKHLLKFLDPTHPFHFTEKDLKNLFPSHKVTKKEKHSIWWWHSKHRSSLNVKLKLFLVSLIGVKGILLHLEIVSGANENV